MTTKEKITEEARTLFAQKGYKGTSVKNIADAVAATVAYVEIVAAGGLNYNADTAIMLSDVKFTLIDSLNKRVTFLKEVCVELNLNNVECIHARAEELGKTAQFREKFDAVVSRAVANMTVLCEYCLPYVRVGGEFIALKSEGCEDEISAAKPMIGTLGAKIENDMTVPLPQSDIMRRLVVIKKIKNTPDKFPRRADKIKKASQS